MNMKHNLKQTKKSSLKQQLILLVGVAVLPFLVMSAYLLVSLNGYSATGNSFPQLDGTDSIDGATFDCHIGLSHVLNPDRIGVVLVNGIFM